MTQNEFLQDLEAFLHEWHNNEPTVWVHTSGSTGTPKPMQVEKERMIASARLTCSFLGLKEGDTALLCMPLQYIAGKMVVVRSLVAGLKLVPVAPTGHPLKEIEEPPTFAAMIPMQLSLKGLYPPSERKSQKAIPLAVYYSLCRHRLHKYPPKKKTMPKPKKRYSISLTASKVTLIPAFDGTVTAISKGIAPTNTNGSTIL